MDEFKIFKGDKITPANNYLFILTPKIYLHNNINCIILSPITTLTNFSVLRYKIVRQTCYKAKTYNERFGYGHVKQLFKNTICNKIIIRSMVLRFVRLGLTLGLTLMLSFQSCKKDSEDTTLIETGTVTDIDGNTYKTVKIGFQWWMAENLRVTHFRNGANITEVRENSAWIDHKSSAWCNYENDANNDLVYGKLYNFYAISDTQNICPIGWHIPTNSEWSALETTVGRNTLLGGKLKEIGFSHWIKPNTGATNETGFTALPGGQRFYLGSFDSKGFNGYWWSSTAANDSMAWYRSLSYGFSIIDGDARHKRFGHSVRCVKD